ncbi:hypothetical protein GCM10011496_33130 [Polaromonas eurypsychrophila]|uniref:Glycosyltransferase n=1 Tax=Polaromonas eurypsychrophila TaxID=1614635 RepID=A0A916WLP5_9BURK|nr:hypothetical protein GCM10011496_33130 [Polaromonas eurypsychrophila]
MPLLPNVALENSPIYKVDLKQFAYGISAPSSILIDMVLAGIPTAVWQDEDSVMDLSNYEGLTRISTLNEWLIFAKDVIENREQYLEKQQTFLRKLKLITNQTSVLQEFSALLLASARHEYKAVMSRVNCQRIMLITPNVGATIQFGFIKPLAYAVASGNAIVEIIEEVELNAQLKAERALFFEGSEWLLDRIKRFKPTLAIFCRWSGPHAKLMLDYFYRNNIPTILYLDDDLLSVPKNIGIDKWARYNEPRRLASLQHLLNHSDLVYASTNTLKHRLEKLCAKPRVLAGEIISSHYRMNSPRIGRVKKIGYMGIGHEEDLEMILGPLIKYLRKNTCVSFELFGTIPIPSGLLEFGDRISKVEKVSDYDEFLSLLPCLEWDIGICPLTKIPFNFLKSNVKWIEYSSAGIPVIASGGTVYDECCAEGCGVLANTEQDWHDALEYLTCNADVSLMMVVKAQEKLRRDYSQSRMRNQVLSMIQSAIQYHANETALINNSFTTSSLQERILFVAKSFLPTMEIYFTNPLRDLIDDGVFSVDFISENQIYSVERKKSGAINKIGMSDFSSAELWIIERFNSFSPSILVLVRYSGPHSELLVRLARARRIPIIYHLDDDLLNVPVSAGLEKQKFHNQPERLSVVRRLLETSTLVVCSTKALMNQMRAIGHSAPVTTTQITCALNVQAGVRAGLVRKIGYMGGADHVDDFSTIVGALVLLLRKHTQIIFEFFGGMPIPDRLKEFGDRVKHIHPSINYEQFLARFSACEWDIGLCPLDKVHFNLMKTPIKWFDYTSIGAAVVATRGTVYDVVCADNCGGLAGSETEWFDVLDDLIKNPSIRYLMAANAQNKLKQNYSVSGYRQEILKLFNQAHQLLQDCSPEKAAV